MQRLRERMGNVSSSRRRHLEVDRESVPVEVVLAEEMTDETFSKHLNARHLKDLGISGPVLHREFTLPSYYESLRAFHDRVHKISLAGHHDHTHEE